MNYIYVQLLCIHLSHRLWLTVDFKMCFGDDGIDVILDTVSDIITISIVDSLIDLCCVCCQEENPPPTQEQVRRLNYTTLSVN